jgi:hypothetical protein
LAAPATVNTTSAALFSTTGAKVTRHIVTVGTYSATTQRRLARAARWLGKERGGVPILAEAE